MSEMCYTIYEFHGNIADLCKLYEPLKQFVVYDIAIDISFAAWVNNILKSNGCTIVIDDRQLENIEINDIYFVEENVKEPYILLVTETESEPLDVVWYAILQALKLYNVRYCFRSENAYENAENIKYDPHNLFIGVGDYYVAYDYHGTSVMPYGVNGVGRFYTERQVVEILQVYTGSHEVNMDKLLDIALTHDINAALDDFIYVIKYRDITNE